MIVSSKSGATLVGGAPFEPGILARCLKRAPTLVAADGGAARALEMGHMPVATIGDLDSLPQDIRAQLPHGSVHEIAEQDTTDFAKVLRNVEAPLLLAVGFAGGLLDHTLAVLSSLVARDGAPCLLVSEQDIAFHVPHRIALSLPVGCRVSLYPLTTVHGRSTGLAWPIEGLSLGPMAQLGTSNHTVAPEVTLAFDAPGTLVMLPAAQLDAVLSALAAT